MRLEALLAFMRDLDARHARRRVSLQPGEIRPWELRGEALDLIERALVDALPAAERRVQALARAAVGR